MALGGSHAPEALLVLRETGAKSKSPTFAFKAMREMKFNAPLAVIDGLFDEWDPDGSNKLELKELKAILEEHKRNCERAGKYIEADIAKKRLEELRQHEENRRDESLRSRQVAQRLGIEEAHMLEFQQFNAMWDRTMKV